VSSDLVPAWSEPFLDDGPSPGPQLGQHPDWTAEWAYGDRSGAGVTVAIVDSGVAEIPSTAPIARSMVVELADDGPPTVAEGGHRDLTGHGTACAAIVRSLAPQVELESVRVLGANLKGRAEAFAAGVGWCIDQGIDIVNLSLSTSNERHLSTFHQLVDRAAWRRTLIVSAMITVRKPTIPSELAGVCSVACAPVDDRETIRYNPDGPAEWAAAGIDVEVEWGETGSVVATGNSFAAPVIAGHLARIRSAHPGLAAWQVRAVLASLASNT
jgi:subtilisin family serine protease